MPKKATKAAIVRKVAVRLDAEGAADNGAVRAKRCAESCDMTPLPRARTGAKTAYSKCYLE